LAGLEAIEAAATAEVTVAGDLEPIYLKEYELSEAPLSDGQFELLRDDARAHDHLGLYFVPEEPMSYLTRWRLKASCKVGVAWVGDKEKGFSIHVNPKVEDADFLTMLDYAYWEKGDPLQWDDIAALESLQDKLVGLVVYFFLRRLEQFVQRHLRRDYVLRQERLNARVRGKPLVQQYIARSLPYLQDHIVPCQFSELSRDTLSNRILLWTLHVVDRAVAGFDLTHRRLLSPKIIALRHALAGVSLVPVRLGDFGRIRYASLHTRYRDIHELCRFILQHFRIENVAGEVRFREFTLDMNDLFERFVRGVLRVHLAGRFEIDEVRLTRRYGGPGTANKKIKLDGLIRDDNGEVAAVVECKYRQVWETEEQNLKNDEFFSLQGGRLRNSEVFQSIAYATHAEIRAPRVLLIYPIVGQGGDVVSSDEPVVDFGYGPGGDKPVEVYFLGVDIGGSLAQGLKAFARRIEELSRRE
jgi:5-methylcytosine-specific restriction endonuclease McrBC regulatory subunit McrC